MASVRSRSRDSFRDCYEFAKKHGIIVIGEYIDKAMTGRVDRRPDFQRMMKDSEKGPL
ncbi:MAG: recombinase family protein [Escherichia coli]